MHPRTPLPLLSLLLLGVAPLPAQERDVERVIALGRTENRVMEHLDHLSNRIGPRLTGSENYRIACEWARARFEAFGLQDPRLEAWGEFPVGFNRGPASGRMLQPVEKPLRFGTNAWTAGTLGRVAGPALLAPTNDEELEAIRPRLSGAWVLLPRRPRRAPRRPPEGSAVEAAEAPADPAAAASPDGEPRTDASEEGAPSSPGPAPPDPAFLERVEAALEAAGAAGGIRPTRDDLVLTGGRHRVEWEALPRTPAINLLASEYEEIRSLLENGEEVRLEFDVRNWFREGPVPVHNVVAEIPGTERPEEVVIVCGHLDTWDGATGTTDNGTGVATTMEAARLLAAAGALPRRTLRFVLWGGEEQGLLGSRAYVEAHRDEMPRVSAVLNHDMGTNYLSGIPATPAMRAALEAVFAPVRGLDPAMPFEVREVNGLRGGGSDHASFLAADVPAFAWDQAGRANYTHTHHTQHDTFDAAIPEYQAHSAIVVAVGALGIADLPDLLPRDNLRAPGGGGRRRLGLSLADGLEIEEVFPESPAAKAGFRKGDRILAVGDDPVAERRELFRALAGAGSSPRITVARDGVEIEIQVEVPDPRVEPR